MAPVSRDVPARTNSRSDDRACAVLAAFKWAHTAYDMDVRMGGVEYWRQAELSGDTLRTTMSRRSYMPEITAAQAKDVNDRLPTFNNNISRVYERKPTTAGKPPQTTEGSRDPMALTVVATKALTDNRPQEAQRLIDRALAINPKYSPALRLKFDLLLRREDFPTALATLDAIRAVDRSDDLTAKRAELLIRLGRKAEGLSLFDTFVSSPRADPLVNFQAAKDAAWAGATDRARAIVAAGLKLAPDAIDLLQLQAFYMLKDGQPDKALADADTAIHLQPEGKLNFLDRALTLNKLGRHAEALAAMDEALRIDPLLTYAIEVRIDTLHQLGRKAEVAQACDDRVSNDRVGIALNERCWDRATKGVELDQAEADCAGAVKLGPNIAAFWDSYGLVALKSGRPEEARRRYDRALTLTPNLAPSLYARGVLKLRAGDIAAAEALDHNVEAQLKETGLTP